MTGASGGRNFPPTQRIGIFVYEGFEPIDVFGFAEAFTIARFLGTGYGDPPPYPFAVTLIGRGRDRVKSANGPTVLPDWDMDAALNEPLELLMIPGGGGTWPLLDAGADPEGVAALLDWVRRMHEKVKLMILGQRVPLGRRRPLCDLRRRLRGNGRRLLSGLEARRSGGRGKRCRGRGVRLAARPADPNRLPPTGGVEQAEHCH